MTTKWDMVSVELSRRLGDPISAANSDGEWLTANVRNGYVNKALHKLFADVLIEVKGDRQAFIKIFPELVSAPVSLGALNGTTGIYTISSGAAAVKDIWRPWQAYYTSGGNYYHITILEEALFSILTTSINNDYQASSSRPICIYVAGSLYFWPITSTFTPYLVYIKSPLVPATGALIAYTAAAGDNDMPYGYHWVSKLAEIAEQLFKIDKQETA